MSASALLPGVRPHGRRFQIRIHPFPAETRSTAAEANMRALELRGLRDAGVRAVDEPSRAGGWITLQEACDVFLSRKRASGVRRPLTPKGIRHWEDSLRAWSRSRFASLPLRMLRREQLEDFLLERAAAHPTSARNEAQALRAVLLYAQTRGETFAPSLLTLKAPAFERKPARSLSADELEHLAAYTDDRQARLVLIAGTVGNRISELFTLEWDRVDLAGGSIFVPAALCKERRDKVIDLTTEETELLREQHALEHVTGPLVFPKPMGSQWRYSHFRENVWIPALKDADEAWRKEKKTSGSPFPGLTLHALRHTAVSLMREAGVPVEYVAQRVGHADGGALLLKTYRHTRRAEVRRALDGLGTGLRATLAERDSAEVVELPRRSQNSAPSVGDLAVTGSAGHGGGEPVRTAAEASGKES